MNAIIEIEDMEFFAYHGCYETERIVGNKFLVNVEIRYEASRAAQSDDINNALNYFSAYEIIKHEMAIPSHLLEHVAKRILDALYAHFNEILYVKVKVSKLNPPLGGKIKATSVTFEK